ncbi:MAG TPA: ECF-type sigma factor, partial [Pirellulaceae bacterium]|nr:ECF-type sigma factor [Pirellulaceae bacterium]
EPKATSVPGGVGKRQPLDDEPIDHQQVDESIRLVEASQIVNAHLDERDQQIVQMRMEGLDWNQIAEALGESSTALRKHWSRLADQLARELGVKPDPKSSN